MTHIDLHWNKCFTYCVKLIFLFYSDQNVIFLYFYSVLIFFFNAGHEQFNQFYNLLNYDLVSKKQWYQEIL